MNFPPSHSQPAALALFVAALVLAGCAPTVNLATPNPIAVDVNVRLDVYQKTAPHKAKEEQSGLQIAADRRLRSGEIQGLKNARVIGEDRDGFLKVLKEPADVAYRAYTDKVVTDENADRAYLYSANAQTQNKPEEMVERDYAELWRERAFPGEWVQKEDGTWIQK